jgi:PAS domain S-box-containing protein
MIMPEQTAQTIDADTKLYSSRILKLYLEYLQTHYPDVDRTVLLENAGIQRFEIDDPDYWFSQRQVDRFHAALDAVVAHPNIAREVGRYSGSAKTTGPIKQYIMGFLNPRIAYWVVGKVGNRLSRAHTFHVTVTARNALDLRVTLQPGVSEKPFQCENRTGMLEALARIFTNEFAHVEHPRCLHSGDPECFYHITWKEPRSQRWKRFRNALAALSVVFCAGAFFFVPLATSGGLVLLCGLATLLLSWHAEHLYTVELHQQIETQGDAARELLDEMKDRYEHLALIQEISEAIAPILDMEQLVTAVMALLKKHLDFQRGMFLLPDSLCSQLVYHAGYGYTEQQDTFLQHFTVDLDPSKSKHVFLSVFTTQMPAFFSVESRLSDTERHMAEHLNIQSLVCIPIVHQHNMLGILAFDQPEPARPVTKTDLNLLTAIAAQIAFSVTNIHSFQQLQQSEERYRSILKNMEEGFYEVDLTGHIAFCNDALCRMLGYSRNELLGMESQRLLAETAFKEVVRTALNEVFHTTDDIWEILGDNTFGEYEIVRKDGTRRIMESSITLKVDHDGHPIGFQGVSRDITDRKQAEAKLKAALHEKEILLKEIHHRVKNNLQVISSLLNLQARVLHNEQDRALFQESQQRIRTMALIHEKLYQSADLTRIDFREYVNHLLCDISQSYGSAMRGIQIINDIPAIELHIDTVIPCGLIINELVSNALKYAFPEGEGTLKIAFRLTDTRYQLMIQDDGVGLSESFDLNHLDSLGLQLVQGLVEEQLDGTFELQRDAPGTCWCISFQEQPNKEAQS